MSMMSSMDAAAASVIARWIDQRAARPDLPLRLNLRLRFGSPSISAAVRAELEARSDERRRFFVRTSDDDDAVALRHGRPPGVAQDGSFFRKGVVGDWRSTVTPEINDMILRELGWMFSHFGWMP